MKIWEASMEISDGNSTIQDICFEAKKWLDSDYPEIFLAGLGCCILNIIFFTSWVILLKLLKKGFLHVSI